MSGRRKSNCTILVADDDHFYLDKLCERFSDHTGWRVLKATNASDALKSLHDMGGNIDIVLLDVMMPRGDNPALKAPDGLGHGVQAGRKIREKYGNVRLFGFSVDATKEQVDWFKTHGNGFVEKEALRPGRFRETLRTFEKTKSRKPRATTKEKPPRNHININDIRPVVDIGIMTVREDEFSCVLDRMKNRRTVIGGRQYYEFTQVRTAEGAELGVVVVRCPEQGQGVAQSVARDLIDDLSPPWLFLVGIAGGIPCDEYTLGDVALATRLHDFSVSAALQGKPSEFNVTGGPMHIDVENLLSHLRAYESRFKGWNQEKSIRLKKPPVIVRSDIRNEHYYGSKAWREKVRDSLKARFSAGKRLNAPRYLTSPTISSNSLVKNANLVKQWQKAARHASTVEMELGGVYHAARRGGKRDCRMLAIRGISDIVGFKRSGDWTAYACNSAAAFACALIKSGVISRRSPGKRR